MSLRPHPLAMALLALASLSACTANASGNVALSASPSPAVAASASPTVAPTASPDGTTSPAPSTAAPAGDPNAFTFVRAKLGDKELAMDQVVGRVVDGDNLSLAVGGTISGGVAAEKLLLSMILSGKGKAVVDPTAATADVVVESWRGRVGDPKLGATAIWFNPLGANPSQVQSHEVKDGRLSFSFKGYVLGFTGKAETPFEVEFKDLRLAP